MKIIVFLAAATISQLTFASDQISKITGDIYFSPGWCPREDEIVELSKYLTLTMNGCCIKRGIPNELFSQNKDAITPWRHRIISNNYPYARCDGAPITADEDARQLSEYDEQKKISDENRKDEIARYRKTYPSLLKTMSDIDLCVLLGNAVREEEFQQTIPQKESFDAIKTEAKRRRVSFNLKLVRSEKIQIGMSECELLASWGTPKKRNRTVGNWGVHIQHIYGDFGPYVYTKNGRISSWQD